MKRILSLILTVILAFTLVACSSNKDKNANFDSKVVIDTYNQQVAEDQRVTLMDLDDAMLKETYKITPEDVENYYAGFPMMMTQATEIFIARVADGKMEDVKAKVLDRQKALAEQWKTYLPDQYELVQNYKLIEKGNYILFVIGNDADKIVTIFNEQFK